MIRPATLDDAGAIAAIWNPIIRDTSFTFTTVEKTEAAIRAFITQRQRDGRAVLVHARGAVTGFASYDAFRAGPGYALCMEHSLYLAQQARGQGLGAALMTALEAHARAAGHRMFIAAISKSNSAALGFHRAQGFVQVGLIPQAGWKFDMAQDLVLMQKFL